MRIGELEIVNADLAADIQRLKDGTLDELDTFDLFNYLIAYGLVWHMGPVWTGVACNFIRAGYCSLPCSGQC